MKGRMISYPYGMKKRFGIFLVLLAVLPALAACGKSYDYDAHISELRSDIFRAETEEFTVTLSCVSREYPYASDGVACPKSDLVEISLVPTAAVIENYEVYVCGEEEYGGETTFRNTHGDFYFSQSVKSFPQGTVSLRIQWKEEVREISATSVKNDKTLSAHDALASAIEAEKERVDRCFVNDTFRGEFRVRLLRRDRTYYYVGIIDTEGETLSLLLDAETGEILARRDSRV